MTVRVLVAATALAVAGGGAAVAATVDQEPAPAPAAHHGQHAAASQLAGPDPATPSQRVRGLPRIRGTVGPGFTIDVSRRQVPAGRYKLVVRDEADDHNWHIDGRRVDKRTGIGATGRWVWKVRLRPGTYTIICDPHPTSMRTELRVVD